MAVKCIIVPGQFVVGKIAKQMLVCCILADRGNCAFNKEIKLEIEYHCKVVTIALPPITARWVNTPRIFFPVPGFEGPHLVYNYCISQGLCRFAEQVHIAPC